MPPLHLGFGVPIGRWVAKPLAIKGTLMFREKVQVPKTLQHNIPIAMFAGLSIDQIAFVLEKKRH